MNPLLRPFIPPPKLFRIVVLTAGQYVYPRVRTYFRKGLPYPEALAERAKLLHLLGPYDRVDVREVLGPPPRLKKAPKPGSSGRRPKRRPLSGSLF